jgi:hypothetical protein
MRNPAAWVGFAGLAAAALGVAAPPASAQLTANVVPVKCTLSGRPGEVLERDVLIENKSAMPVVVQLALADWTLDSRGTLHLLAGGSSPRSLSGLVQVDPASFSLPALGSRTVRFSVTVPADGPPSRWGVVLSQFRPARVGSAALGSSAVAEIGTTIYLSREGAGSPRMDISGMNVVPTSGDSIEVEVRLRSTGELPVRFQTALAVASDSGATAQRSALPTTVLLPDGERFVTWCLPAPAAPGAYRATCTIDAGEPTLLVGEIPFSWPPTRLDQPLAGRSGP